MSNPVSQQFIRLPNEIIMAIRAAEYDEHRRYLDDVTPRKHRRRFNVGDMVRVDDGPFMDAIRRVEQADSMGRVMILHGMIKLWLESDILVAA